MQIYNKQLNVRPYSLLHYIFHHRLKDRNFDLQYHLFLTSTDEIQYFANIAIFPYIILGYLTRKHKGNRFAQSLSLFNL